jgi:hypothetical protein
MRLQRRADRLDDCAEPQEIKRERALGWLAE